MIANPLSATVAQIRGGHPSATVRFALKGAGLAWRGYRARAISGIGALVLTTTAFAAPTAYLSVGTGATTGLYFSVGKTICAIAAKDANLSASRCYVVSTQGSASNIRDVIKGQLVLGLAQSDTHENAVLGKGTFDKPETELRSIASLYAEPLVIMVRKNSAIQSVRDLNGKRINIGPKGSGQNGLGNLLFDYLQVSSATRQGATTLSSDKHGAALCSNDIDGFIFAIGHPSANIRAPAEDCAARLVPIETSLRQKIISQHSYFIEATIPGNTYPNNPVDVPTFGPVATIVTSTAHTEETIYTVTKALFKQLDALKATHPALKDLQPQQMIQAGLKAPLHPGAIRFYREQGWLR